MDCEAEAIITRVNYEFQNGLEPSIDVSDLVDEKDPPKEEHKKVALRLQKKLIERGKTPNLDRRFNSI